MVAYGICLSLTSLNMIISRSFHVTAMALFHSFLYLSNSSLCVYTASFLPFYLKHKNFDDISLSEFPFLVPFFNHFNRKETVYIRYHNSDFFLLLGFILIWILKIIYLHT